MTQTSHLPHDYLNPDGSIGPAQLALLRQQAESVATDPATGHTRYDLGANPLWGGHNLTITVNPAASAYDVVPRPHCACRGRRPPIQCECTLTACPSCGQEITALTTVCEFELCLHDECPACSHYRETCFAQELIDEIHNQASGMLDGMTQAEAMVGAVSEILGAHSGEAPIFPLTDRAIRSWSQFREASGEDHNRRWTFSDSSYARPDEITGIWLEAAS